ncbi:site-specific integrase [Mucilaginibacter sp. PAMB04168]|uniref:site-specific integrase n=1 Tax=Mucilaginibacter sp. PAMB04168 TaxID=3138567 RepID=UPI0031F6B4FD
MVSKLHILFFLYRSKANCKDTMPVYCRLTLNGQRKQFSSGCYLKEIDWDVKGAVQKGASIEAKHCNNRLKTIRNKLMQAYDALLKSHDDFNASDLYDQYLGNKKNERTLLGIFDFHIAQIKTLVNKDYSIATLNKFTLIRSHVCAFIKEHHRLPDYPLPSLNLGFLLDFEHFLKVDKRQNQNTVNKTIERVKKVVHIAVAHGWLKLDPFALYRKKRFVKEVVFLNSEELELLEKHPLSATLNKVRDLFIFSCYTGLAYHELSGLRSDHLKKDKKGWLWIEMIRQKTKRPIAVPLLPKALSIVKCYGYPNNEGFLFPSISNQKLNVYLKELASQAGINKHLTHHIARKTFASTVLLNNEIPMDVASFLLGHSKMSTTEDFYAKVQRERVVFHLNKLA